MKTIRDRTFLILGLGLALLMAADVVVRLEPTRARPGGAVDGATLGRAYARTVVSTLADAWGSAADGLARGKTVAEVEASIQGDWRAARTKDFVARVAPEFSKVLTEGTEPKDDAHRAEVVSLWSAFARGLKGGR